MGDDKVKHSIFGIGNYFVYFLISSLVVTIAFWVLHEPNEISSNNLLKQRAILTFFVILLIALVFTLINGLWRRYTIGRPVKKILEATRKVTEGQLDVRIEPLHGLDSINELDAIITNFNKMTKELGNVEALQTDFIASVSHELKTPLAVIQNYATILQDPDLTAQERKNYAQRIADATIRLNRLVTNILKLNKLDNQSFIIHKKRYLLNEQLAAALINYEPLWEKKKIEIDADMEDIYITSDKDLLELAWNNLISNAIKFSLPGGHIRISILRSSKNELTVKISDNGIGMTENVRRHIFDRFYQADTARAVQGNGLGLALVKRIVYLIGGKINVVSEENKGTTFSIILPISKPE